MVVNCSNFEPAIDLRDRYVAESDDRYALDVKTTRDRSSNRRTRGRLSVEFVENAINDVTQKYLNFLDLGSGFAVTPSGDGVVTFGSYSPEGTTATGGDGTLAQAVFAAVASA